jgi:peptide/nickel transport system substrate-binding protein
LNACCSSLARVVLLALVVALAPPMSAPAAATPEGQITIAVHVSLAPTWFDPAETPGVITPFLTLYALHDALVKPMPGNAWAPSLAESWTASKDGLTYEFASSASAARPPATPRPASRRS